MRKFVLLCLIILTSSVFAAAQIKPEKNENNQNKEFRSPFRYVIINGVSEVEKYVNRLPDENLYLEVLLEDKAFTEENLKMLFELLSERYRSVPALTIWVYTSLNAVRTPDENDHLNLRGPIDSYFKYKYAYFWRNLVTEGFDYSIPNSTKKTVILKNFK